MRDDFNKSSFCETMSSAHACSAAMVRSLSHCFVVSLSLALSLCVRVFVNE